MASTVLLVLMVIPSAIPLLVAAHHYYWPPLKKVLTTCPPTCWPPLKNVLTTCPPTCCQSNNPDDTDYALVDRHEPVSNAHEMPATGAEHKTEQMLQKDHS